MSFGGRCGATLRWCGYCIRLVAQREPLDHYGWCWKRGAERWDSRCALFSKLLQPLLVRARPLSSTEWSDLILLSRELFLVEIAEIAEITQLSSQRGVFCRIVRMGLSTGVATCQQQDTGAYIIFFHFTSKFLSIGINNFFRNQPKYLLTQ